MFIFSVEKGAPSVLYKGIYLKTDDMRSAQAWSAPPPRRKSYVRAWWTFIYSLNFGCVLCEIPNIASLQTSQSVHLSDYAFYCRTNINI